MAAKTGELFEEIMGERAEDPFDMRFALRRERRQRDHVDFERSQRAIHPFRRVILAIIPDDILRDAPILDNAPHERGDAP